MNRKKTIVTAVVLMAVCAWTLIAGDLNPPGPPTAGTMKPLDQIEPRTAVQTLSGNINSTYVIAQSGSYYLTGNLAASLNKHAIEITADHVTLDLCGFTIIGSSTLMDEIRHGVYMSGRTNIEIRNGTIRNCKGHGIYEAGAEARGHRVLSVRVRACKLYGLYLKGREHLVTGCTVVSNDGPGIHAGYPSTVKDNHQGDNGDNMLPVESGGFLFQGTELVDQPDFYIAKFEMTNAEYCEFLNEADVKGQYYHPSMEINQSGTPGQYTYTVQSGKESHPIRYVSAYDAQAYADWKSRVTGLNYRLLTEEEWEKAAGCDPVQKKLWRYGFQKDTIDATWCNYNNAYGGPLPVGSFNGTGGKNDAPSWYGCYDMTGNVWEWTTSFWEPGSRYRILRGGDWGTYDYECGVTFRNNYLSSSRGAGNGFRLARDFE
jgi:formylglycine-generating enzyme required for sulfatase activity